MTSEPVASIKISLTQVPPTAWKVAINGEHVGMVEQRKPGGRWVADEDLCKHLGQKKAKFLSLFDVECALRARAKK